MIGRSGERESQGYPYWRHDMMMMMMMISIIVQYISITVRFDKRFSTNLFAHLFLQLHLWYNFPNHQHFLVFAYKNLSLRTPQKKKKSIGVESGERAGQSSGPLRPIHFSGKVSRCSRKNLVFLFGALINLTVRVNAYFHPIRMIYPIQPGPFSGQHQNGKSTPNALFLRTFQTGQT